MSELIITDPEQVADIKRLRDELLEILGENVHQAFPVPYHSLEVLARGPLHSYRLTTDAVAHFLLRDTNFMRILYNCGQYWVKMMILEDRVGVFSQDLYTGAAIAIPSLKKRFSSV